MYSAAMAFPKRGTRNLEVDGRSYLWHISPKYVDFGSALATLRLRDGGPILHYHLEWFPSGAEAAELIRWAISAGWLERKSASYVARVRGAFELQDYLRVRSRRAAYGHLPIQRSDPPPTPADIALLEIELGAQLPKSFLDFLSVGNGGYLDYVVDIPTTEGRSEALSFCSFFSTTSSSSNGTFLSELRRARERSGISIGVLPFARDGGGSVVYLDLSAGAGRVVALITSLPARATSESGNPGLFPLATSFREYVGMLRLDRDAVLDELEHASEWSQVAATEAYLDNGLPGWWKDAQLAKAMTRARRRVTPRH